MTPRSMLTVVVESDVNRARGLADANRFEAIPIVREGKIVGFWSRSGTRVKPITPRHRVQYDGSVDWVLPRLTDHLVQFVYYGDEVVGLVDLSDLNKPLARLIVLRPLLECEQAISLMARAQRVTDDQIATILNPGVIAQAQRRKRKAAREDLEVPLLEFVEFRHVLEAGVALGLLAISETDIERLVRIRNRSAHGVLSLVEGQDDGYEVIWALKKCKEMLRILSVS